MATLVSTGQITIVDNNDAKPITAFITASGTMQQTYTADESSIVYLPDWTSTNNTLTAKVYVGGVGSATDITSALLNKKWSNDLSGSIGAAVTFAVNTNLTTAAPAKTYYFEGDYTDPVTGLTSHIIAQIALGLVKTGTNAVYINVTGQDVIESATGVTKNTAVLKADLIRAAGIDDTGVTYRWTEVLSGSVINTSLAGYSTKYGFQTTAQANAGSGSAIGIGVPAGTAFANTKGIIISETAVTNFSVIKVECTDSIGLIYQATFTVRDVSDMYSTMLVSTSGDKLQNGVGSTNIYPIVYYGSNVVGDTTSWSFKYSFYDGAAPGNKAGFIDTTRTALATGRPISAHSTTTAGIFTVTIDTAIVVANQDLVKLVMASGVAKYYEVASYTTSTITLRQSSIATSLTWLTWAGPSNTTDFVGGKLFVCLGTGATAGTQTKAGGATATAAQITVTGYEIDVKGTIICEATRP
jgi:hypothetical protein